MQVDIPKIQLTRGASFPTDFLIVDGSWRSGKSMVGRIAASLARVEPFRISTFLDLFLVYATHKKLDDNAARVLLQIYFDASLRQGLLGREMNLRLADDSSVLRQRRPIRSLLRLAQSDSKVNLDSVVEAQPIYHDMTHNGLPHIRVLLEAFEQRLRLVHVHRSPAAVVLNLAGDSYLDRLGNDPRDAEPKIEERGIVIPLAARGRAQDWVKANNAERAIILVCNTVTENILTYQSLTQAEKAQVLPISFDNFVSDPQAQVQRLCEFLGTRATAATARSLRKERVPRPSSRIVSVLDVRNGLSEPIRETFIDELEWAQHLYETWSEECVES